MKLLGPVLLTELIRLARRSRYILLRCLYPLLLLGALSLLYQDYFYQGGLFGQARADPARLARFAEAFFNVFMVGQFLVVLLLTPAYVAGAVAEEKQRRTLEFLLTTDLRSREIILSKLVSRLAHLTLLLLAGLPVLSLVQLFGGVDPVLLWCGFAATGLTMLSLTSLSLLFSVYARRPREALGQVYVTVLGYFAVWGLLLFLQFLHIRGAFRLGPTGTWVLDTFLGISNAGNIFAALADLQSQVSRTGNYGNRLGELLRNYALFHGLAAVLCVTVAVWRLRPMFVYQTYNQKPKQVRRQRSQRPIIGAYPMVWKEVYYERIVRRSFLGKVLVLLLFGLFLVPGLLVLANYFYTYSSFKILSEQMNIYVRIAGTLVACLALLRIAVHAASSIGTERDRRTFDSLLVTPLSEQSILFGKWLGSLASARTLLILLGLIWLLGAGTGGLHILAIPFLLLCLSVYAAFAASLGMVFAAGSKTTLRAMLYTVATALFVGGGHWFCTWCCVLGLLNVPGIWGRTEEWLLRLGAGLTPPFVLGLAQASVSEFELFYGRGILELLLAGAFGLLVFAGSAFALWGVAVEQFRRTCGRIRGLRRTHLPPVDSAGRIHKRIDK